MATKEKDQSHSNDFETSKKQIIYIGWQMIIPSLLCEKSKISTVVPKGIDNVINKDFNGDGFDTILMGSITQFRCRSMSQATNFIESIRGSNKILLGLSEISSPWHKSSSNVAGIPEHELFSN